VWLEAPITKGRHEETSFLPAAPNACGSGIVTIEGQPYPNGRNQESSSEAIHAYEAVAVYGDVMQQIFEVNRLDESHPEAILYENALRVRDMSRLMMATEVHLYTSYDLYTLYTRIHLPMNYTV
jgi:hypothetical protein